MRNSWEERLNMIFDQMNNKLNTLEKNIEGFKKDNSEVKIE